MLEVPNLFQHYDDAFVQPFHFVVMYVDMKHNEIYLFVENIYGFCGIHHPNKIKLHGFKH